MSRPIALLDCDGPLTDFVGGTVPFVRSLAPELANWQPAKQWDFCANLPEQYQKAVYKYWCTPGFCASLKPIDGAQAAIEELQKHHDVYIVTAPMPGSATWASEREESLAKHFGIKRGQIVSTEAKHLIFGDYFLDDKLRNLQAWNERWAGHPYRRTEFSTLLWKMFHNEDHHHLDGAHDWPALLELVLG